MLSGANTVQASFINASVVIATMERSDVLRRALTSLAEQSAQPIEVIVVDASAGSETQAICCSTISGLLSKVRWVRAEKPGAAQQRCEGVALAGQEVIWFFDDDVLFEPECVARLWNALQQDGKLGGVNAMITNQRYHNPGTMSRLVYTLMNGKSGPTFAGKVIGPAINLLPADSEDLPDVVPVEWLNTTCTMYRREALPDPVFDSFFTDYSMMEDLTLSLRVRQRDWQLANARTARILHDSQSALGQVDRRRRAKMELFNRAYVMQRVLQQNSLIDWCKLAAWEMFSLASVARARGGIITLPSILAGKIDAIRAIGESGREP